MAEHIKQLDYKNLLNNFSINDTYAACEDLIDHVHEGGEPHRMFGSELESLLLFY
jgi:hypothetical protein